jgi:hypothetical protein
VAVAGEVEQAGEGVGVGDAEVVAGEEAEAASAVEEVAEVLLHADDAAPHGEADGDVGSLRAGQLFAEVGQGGAGA